MFDEKTSDKKPLKFLHITQNVGSSIEKEAVKKGVLWGRFDDGLRGYLKDDIFGFFWHYPVSKLKSSLFEENDVFVVVRNPYERAVSECFWELEESGPKVTKNNLSKENFNQIISERIKGEKQENIGHWLLQSNYVFNEQGEKVARYALKFEELPDNFNNLMKECGLPVILHESTRENASNKIYGPKDLSPEIVKIINEYYQEDFDNFGYQKM